MWLGGSGNKGSLNAASATSPRALNEDNSSVDRSTIVPSKFKDTSSVETSSVSIRGFANDSSLIETSAMPKIDPVRPSLMCPGIWKGGAASTSLTNSKDGSNFDVSPMSLGDEASDKFFIDPRNFTHDDVTKPPVEVASMPPRKLDHSELFFKVSWTTPSGSKEGQPIEVSPKSTCTSMVSVTIPGELKDHSPVEVPSVPISTSHKNDTPVEPPTISPTTSNNPISPTFRDSPIPSTPSHRLPKDFLETLKKHGAAYIVDSDDTISITWLSCPTTVSDIASNTTASKAIPNPTIILETLLPASQIMLYDDSISKPLSYYLDPANEEMEYDTWLWVKSELDDYFLNPTNHVTKTTLWSTYNPCHHAHDADKLPSWALTVVFNYRDDLGCRVVYYPPSVRDLKGFWDFSGLDSKREDSNELITPDIVKEAVEMLVAPFYHGPKGVSEVSV
jgi:hypothetical protein